MSIEKSEAIILRTWKYGDTSRIVSLYTRRFGKLRLIAKGARSKKPRFGASLEPFTESLIVFYRKRERELQVLSSSDSIADFARLRERPVHLGLACAMVESVERLTALEQEDRELYALVRGALAAIEASAADGEAETAFWRAQMSLVAHLGYRWEMEACVSCGAAAAGARIAVDPLEGALCAECARSHRDATSIAAVTRAALVAGLPETLAGETLRETRRLFSLFYERCGLGKGPLRSLGYLTSFGPEDAK
jgi:DNA repair protein RecO (recombination protein O)